jgi:photosystem II S4 domain protein
MGAQPEDLGDLWVRGDRGGQGLISPNAAELLQGRRGQLRDVEIHCDVLEISQLQLPAQRNPKRLTTVEASCRIDAIASAGFGLSRSKVVSQIKAGRLRLNWEPVRHGSRELKVGDRLQLQDRGSLELLSCTLTKRERWRIELMRR